MSFLSMERIIFIKVNRYFSATTNNLQKPPNILRSQRCFWNKWNREDNWNFLKWVCLAFLHGFFLPIRTVILASIFWSIKLFTRPEQPKGARTKTSRPPNFQLYILFGMDNQKVYQWKLKYQIVHIFNWVQVPHNWDVIVPIKYQHYLYYFVPGRVVVCLQECTIQTLFECVKDLMTPYIFCSVHFGDLICKRISSFVASRKSWINLVTSVEMDGSGFTVAAHWSKGHKTRSGETHPHLQCKDIEKSNKSSQCYFLSLAKERSERWMGWAEHMGAGWEASEAKPTDGERLSHVSKWENTFWHFQKTFRTTRNPTFTCIVCIMLLCCWNITIKWLLMNNFLWLPGRQLMDLSCSQFFCDIQR